MALVDSMAELQKITDVPEHEIQAILEVGTKVRVEYTVKESMQLERETPAFYSPIIAGKNCIDKKGK